MRKFVCITSSNNQKCNKQEGYFRNIVIKMLSKDSNFFFCYQDYILSLYYINIFFRKSIKKYLKVNECILFIFFTNSK